MPAVADEAVVLRAWDWSETSQTSLLFARDRGLLRGLAKGSRRPNNRFSGGLEPLTRGEVLAIVKPSAELATLTAWDLREIFPGLRGSLRAFYAGAYMAELVQRGVTDHDPHPGLFDALVAALRLLEHAPDTGEPVLSLQWAVLSEAGYRPELDRDVRTGAALPPGEASYGFLADRGGFTRDDGLPEAWRVRADTLAALRRAAQFPRPQPGPPPATTFRAVRLLDAYLSTVLGTEFTAGAPFLEHLERGILPTAGGDSHGRSAARR